VATTVNLAQLALIDWPCTYCEAVLAGLEAKSAADKQPLLAGLILKEQALPKQLVLISVANVREGASRVTLEGELAIGVASEASHTRLARTLPIGNNIVHALVLDARHMLARDLLVVCGSREAADSCLPI
jgi:hypothetical protein